MAVKLTFGANSVRYGHHRPIGYFKGIARRT